MFEPGYLFVMDLPLRRCRNELTAEVIEQPSLLPMGFRVGHLRHLFTPQGFLHCLNGQTVTNLNGDH